MDEFREWLSDNLRYFMLGFGIIAVLILLFFGIRFVADTFEDKPEEQQKVEQQEDSQQDTEEQSVTPEVTPEAEETMDVLEKNAYPTVNALMDKYYTALGSKDIDTLKTLVDELSTEEQTAILNDEYIDSYSGVETYTKPGVKEGSYVVFSCFGHKYRSYVTILPGMGCQYVDTREDGSLYIVANPTEEQQQCITDAMNAEDTQALIAQQQQAYEDALAADPQLTEYLSQLGVNE